MQKIELAKGWSLKAISPRQTLDEKFLAEAWQTHATDGWLTVPAMPAMVHDILLSHGKIEPPWLPHGTEKCFWVGEKDWVYATRFSVEQPERASKLRFKGLKGKVDIYLNGACIATHPNTDVPLLMDLEGRLQRQNTLVLHFHATYSQGKDGTKADGRRKNLGSYLGPNPDLIALGVFDRVFLEVTDGIAMDEIVASVSLDKSLGLAMVGIDVVGKSRHASVAVRTRLLDPSGQLVSESMTPATMHESGFGARCVLEIERPQLWWPRGYGEQPLYRAEVALLVGDRLHQTEWRTIGFRRITMPELLHFVVNDVPVMLRGGAHG